METHLLWWNLALGPLAYPLPTQEQISSSLFQGLRLVIARTLRSSLRHRHIPPLNISERQRHRYEVNPRHIGTLTLHRLSFIGKGNCGECVEVFELADHPYFVSVRFHPEYLSRRCWHSTETWYRTDTVIAMERVT